MRRLTGPRGYDIRRMLCLINRVLSVIAVLLQLGGFPHLAEMRTAVLVSESMRLTRFHSQVVLHVISEPAEGCAPALMVSPGLIGMTGKTGVLNS